MYTFKKIKLLTKYKNLLSIFLIIHLRKTLANGIFKLYNAINILN